MAAFFFDLNASLGTLKASVFQLFCLMSQFITGIAIVTKYRLFLLILFTQFVVNTMQHSEGTAYFHILRHYFYSF